MRHPLVRGLFAATLAVGLLLCPPAAHSAPQEDVGFPRDEAVRMLSYGFEVIADRHLDPLTGETLAVESLRGLSTLDPALAVSVTEQWVQLSNTRGVIASFSTPADTDIQAWSRVTTDLTLAARRASPTVQKASAEELYQALFDALLSHLDPFSRYAGRAEAAENRASRNGFGGIGIRYLVENGKLAVKEVLTDTPADAAGMKPGDQVIRIDGTDVSGISRDQEQIRQRLRGAINSVVRLTVERNGSVLDIPLRRGLVVPQSVRVLSSDDGIAHIHISSFNQRTTRSLEEAVSTLHRRQPTLRGLLLDLRGNPGGLLDQAVSSADLFMSHGKIVTTRGRHPEAMQSYSAHPDDISRGLPIVVLVDGKSASAAEILAAALQDSGRAVVAGTSSYGKGSVQTVVRLPNDGEMTLTWSRFHSPAGYALQGLGVMPTVCVYDEHMTPDLAVKDIARSNASVLAMTGRWRAVGLNDVSGRAALREHCPPTSHADWSADAAVGRAMLLDSTAYARAVAALTPPADTAALPAGQ